MYYDVLLTALPMLVLLADLRHWLPSQHYTLMPAASSSFRTASTEPLAPGTPAADGIGRVYINSFPLTILGLLYLVENVLMGLNLQATFALGYSADIVTQSDGTTALRAPQLTTATGIRYPWDTALLFLLWLWCGVQLVRGKERRES